MSAETPIHRPGGICGCEGLRKEGPGQGLTGGGAADRVRAVVVVTVGVRGVLGGSEGRCRQGGHPKGGGGGGDGPHTPLRCVKASPQ